MQRIHTHAVILSTGDELMTGQLQDSNARWLSEQLVDIGVLVVAHVAVGDAIEDLVSAIAQAAARAPLVIMSGGLGPTDGDLTREALCRATGDRLVLDEASRGALAAMLARRGRQMTPHQERQVHRPSQAATLPNALGTAPGLHTLVQAGTASSDVFCLPGPPGELRPMFESGVRPLLRPPPDRVVLTRLLHVVGVPEADCAKRLVGLTGRDQSPLVGMTASGGILTIRMRYEAPEPRSAEGQQRAVARIDAVEADIRSRLDRHVLPGRGTPGRTGVEHLAAECLRMLRDGTSQPRTLAVVESCTGGMLGETITAIPGSSSAFLGGFITYANALKERLGVPTATLAEHGAVSPQTAIAMAECGMKEASADFCLSLTGIAGPDGGTAAKPVGTVHIALAFGNADRRATISRAFMFTGDREDIRQRACAAALMLLYFHLASPGTPIPRLSWETTSPAAAPKPRP